MTLALIPGTFDPVTNGHIDLVLRAGKIFDEIVVAVGVNATKEAWLTPGKRVELIESSLAEQCPEVNARVVSFDGLLADLAKELGAAAIVKGVRGVVDLDSETIQSEVNRDLCGVETVLLPARSGLGAVSSSLVRELFIANGDVRVYVPGAVWSFLQSITPKKPKPAGFGA